MLRQALGERVLFDGRNLYDPRLVAANGLEYHCIGRPLQATVAPARRQD